MKSNSALEDVKSRPWHLKLDVTLFDGNGKNPNAGSIEVWQSGLSRKTIFTFGASVHTELVVDDKKFYKSIGEPTPNVADEVLEGFMHPGPRDFDIEDATPEVRKQKLGKQEIECLMLSHPIRETKQPPLGLFPTYCAIEGSLDPRISYPAGSDIIERQKIGVFLGHRVTTELSISQGTAEIAHAKAATLSTIADEAEEFKPTDDMYPAKGGVARVAAGVLAGAKIAGRSPMYPVSARSNHVSGTVVLRALIGVDGYIHTLRIVSAPDPDLAIASIAAVRTWQYKPYLLNGEPTSVDTTVTVHFNLGPG